MDTVLIQKIFLTRFFFGLGVVTFMFALLVALLAYFNGTTWVYTYLMAVSKLPTPFFFHIESIENIGNSLQNSTTELQNSNAILSQKVDDLNAPMDKIEKSILKIQKSTEILANSNHIAHSPLVAGNNYILFGGIALVGILLAGLLVFQMDLVNGLHHSQAEISKTICDSIMETGKITIQNSTVQTEKVLNAIQQSAKVIQDSQSKDTAILLEGVNSLIHSVIIAQLSCDCRSSKRHDS